MILCQLLTFHPRNVSPVPRAQTRPIEARSGWGTRGPCLSRWPGPGTRSGGRRQEHYQRRPHQDNQSHPATWGSQGRGNQNLSLKKRDNDGKTSESKPETTPGLVYFARTQFFWMYRIILRHWTKFKTVFFIPIFLSRILDI